MDISSLKSVFFFKTFFKVKSDDHTLSHLHTLALSIIPSSAALWRQFDWQTPLRTNCCCTWRRMLFFGAEVLHATDCEVRVQRAAEASEQDRPVWAAALGGRARVVTQKTSGQCYICAGKKDEVSWHMVVVLLWFFFPPCCCRVWKFDHQPSTWLQLSPAWHSVLSSPWFKWTLHYCRSITFSRAFSRYDAGYAVQECF